MIPQFIKGENGLISALRSDVISYQPSVVS